MFNLGLIDSLKLRIKKSEIKVIDPALILPYLKFYPDNLSFENSLNDAEPFTKVINGITYRYYFKTYPNKNGYLEEYLVLQVSAKMLKSKYFEGITKNNYRDILNDINAQYVVFIPENVFLNALVSDIDICINQLIDIKSYETAISLMNNYPKSSCKPLMHTIKKVNKQGKIINLGLDFNKREKATNSRPYCKVYHKGIELQTKSAIFYNAFLSPQKASFLDNLVRYEFTIKAYDHKKYLTEKGLLTSELKTFNDLINLDSKQLTNIAKSGLNHYLEPRKQKTIANDLNPIDRLISFYISELINKGSDIDDIKHVLNFYECPVTKSRIKSKINQILKHLNNENPTLEKLLNENKICNQFLKNLGY